MMMCFATFVLSVHTSSNCHLTFEPLGHSALLDTLHCVQPWCPPSLYPSKLSLNTMAQAPAVVEDDSVQAADGSVNAINDDSVKNMSSSGDVVDWQWFYPHMPNCTSPQHCRLSPDSVANVPSPASSPPILAGGLLDLALVTTHLQSLTETIKILSPPTSVDSPSSLGSQSSSVLLSTMSCDEVLHLLLLHHDFISLPTV